MYYKFDSSTGQFVEMTRMDVDLTQTGAIPVMNTAETAQYLRGTTRRWKKPLPTRKSVMTSKQLLTYIWSSASPYDSPYGAVSIPCVYGKSSDTNDGASVVDSMLHPLANAEGAHLFYPMHLYDLTCAPNYVNTTTGAQNTVAVGCLVKNPYVARTFGACLKNLGTSTAGTGWTDKVPYKTFCSNHQLYSQFSDGVEATQALITATNSALNNAPVGDASTETVRNGNRWFLKYMKKAIPWYSSGAPAPSNTSGSDVIPVGLKVENTTQMRLIATPPVGERPLHVSTKVKLCLVGVNSAPVDYDISLVRFKEDVLCPRTTTDTVWISGAGSSDANANDTFASLFWHNFNMPYTHGPSCRPDTKVISKGCQILSHRRVTVQPKQTNISDSSLNHSYITLNFKWNELRSFKWRPDYDQGYTQAIPGWDSSSTGDHDKHGVGYTTNIANFGNVTNVVSPRSRIYLVIRCRSPMQKSAAFGQMVDPQVVVPNQGSVTTVGTPARMIYAGGESHFGNATTPNEIPTYDITIENTWMPDTNN